MGPANEANLTGVMRVEIKLGDGSCPDESRLQSCYCTTGKLKNTSPNGCRTPKLEDRGTVCCRVWTARRHAHETLILKPIFLTAARWNGLLWAVTFPPHSHPLVLTKTDQTSYCIPRSKALYLNPFHSSPHLATQQTSERLI